MPNGRDGHRRPILFADRASLKDFTCKSEVGSSIPDPTLARRRRKVACAVHGRYSHLQPVSPRVSDYCRQVPRTTAFAPLTHVTRAARSVTGECLLNSQSDQREERDRARAGVRSTRARKEGWSSIWCFLGVHRVLHDPCEPRGRTKA